MIYDIGLYSMKIMLPNKDEVLPIKPIPRMSFAGENLTDIRAKEKGAPRTTTDLMISSGLKQVHANYGKGKPDPYEDLKNSRRRLKEMGFVNRENFDDNDDPDDPFDKTRFKDEYDKNITMLDRKERKRLQDLTKGKAYEAWASLKEAREQALIYLNAVSKPTNDGGVENSTDEPKKKVNMHRAGGGPTSRPPSLPPSYFRSRNPDGFRDRASANAIKPYSGSTDHVGAISTGGNVSSSLSDVIKVGKALKKVDRTLFNEWRRWADNVISPHVATVMWDFFYPRTCDLHGMVGTEVW